MTTYHTIQSIGMRYRGIYTLLGILLIGIAINSCSREFSPIIPEFSSNESLITDAIELAPEQSNLLEGIYLVNEPGSRFGEKVVLKFHEGELSIFGKENAAFFLLEGGNVNGDIIFEGYWRYATSLETGRARFVLRSEDGGGEILQENSRPSELILEGQVSDENGPLNETVTLRFQGALSADSLAPFMIIGHRGGGRNSDFHPHSENSLDMIRFSERLGCNAVEIDVQLSSDGVPLLFHDDAFNSRLVEGEYMVGAVSNYTFDQIHRFARLIHGEQIPTLEEALNTIINQTSLQLVWLDIKTPEAIRAVIPLVKDALQNAEGRTPELRIVLGLPLAPIYQAYLELPEEDRLPALCELTPEQTREIDAVIWAPRWTLGLQNAEVAAMHSEGRHVFTWTVDLDFAIREFLYDGDYDGMISNYPTLVAWYHYTRPE